MHQGDKEHGCEVLLFGDYFCDLIITGLNEIPRLGADIFGQSLDICPGGAYILATQLTRLGVHTRWAAQLGDDLFSHYVRECAARDGLDTSLFQEHPQPYRSMSLAFSFSHDRGFISYTDPAPGGRTQKDIISAERPRWVVNTPFDGSEETRELVEYIHSLGVKVFTDCEYTTLTLKDAGITDLLRVTDVFAPNLAEATQLTGESDPFHALDKLADICPMVIIKCGERGAYARQGSRTWHSPAIEVAAVDTTGAGDSFNAGFLAGFINGEDVDTCLRYGNICGGLSTTRQGGTTVAITMEELKNYNGRMV